MALEKIIDDIKTEKLMSRFGEIKVNKDKAISFPEGILGIEGLHKYCLADYPENKLPIFKVLQSIENEEIAFLVLPVTNINETYQQEHLNECLNDLQIKNSDAVLMLIASVHKLPNNDKAKLTVNVRAPIVLDSATRVAYQYVFKYDNYSIQSELN